MKNIAVIGTGYWGKNLVRNFNALGALKWICEANDDVRSRFAEQYPDATTTGRYDEILRDADIEAVAIATPAETHAKLVRDALLVGKDVFVEKPLCLSIEEGQELVDLAKQHNRVLMVGHLLWYHPAVLKLKELIDDGQLGRIEYIYSNRLNIGKIRREESILWSFAPHDISVVLGLLNNEMPESISSQGGSYLHHDIADVTVSMLSFPSGVKAHIFVSWLHPFKEQKLVVVGSEQMAVFDDTSKDEKLTLYPHTVVWENRIPVANKADAVNVPLDDGEPLRVECQHFLECVETRKVPRTDGEEGLRVLTVLDHCQKSLSRRRSSDYLRVARDETQATAQVKRSPPLPLGEGPVAAASDTSPIETRFPRARIHESVFIDDDVRIGNGTSIWHVSHVLPGSIVGSDCRIGQNVVIGPRAIVGNGVKIQNNVSVYEGVTLEDHVFCGPSMVFTNVYNPRSEVARIHELRPTLIKRGATLGANCTVVCGITVGEYAFVGAGSVVIRDVPAYAMVVGNPARQTGWMCECGEKLVEQETDKLDCLACKKQYVRPAEHSILLSGTQPIVE